MEKVVITPYREIHIQISKLRTKTTLDIRTYIKTQVYEGYTQKGINIPLEKGRELAESILKVLNRVETVETRSPQQIR
jgi:hypothetical protein